MDRQLNDMWGAIAKMPAWAKSAVLAYGLFVLLGGTLVLSKAWQAANAVPRYGVSSKTESPDVTTYQVSVDRDCTPRGFRAIARTLIEQDHPHMAMVYFFDDPTCNFESEVAVYNSWSNTLELEHRGQAPVPLSPSNSPPDGDAD